MMLFIAGMDPIAQIILSISASLISIALVVLLIIRGIKFTSSKVKLSLDGAKKKNSDPLYYIFSIDDMESIIDILSSFLEHIYEVSDVLCLKRKMDMAENRMSLLYDYKLNWFSSRLQEKHIAPDDISHQVDFLHYKQVIDKILYLDDGNTPSFKMILHKSLKEKTYSFDPNLTESDNRQRFERYISNMTDEIVQKSKRLWADNYHSTVISFDGKTNQKRIISVEEIIIFESIPESVNLIKNLISEIFKYGIEIDTWAEQEKESIKEDRKKQIQMFLLNRKK